LTLVYVSSNVDIFQTESIKPIAGSDAAENSSVLKSAPVSVIQTAPKTNGVAEDKQPETNGAAPLTNGAAAVVETADAAAEKSSLDIQQPSEQLPAELLQEDPGLTTVASLIDSAEEPEGDEPEAPKKPEVVAATVDEKKSATELASEWETDEPEVEEKEESKPEKMADEAEKVDAETESKDDSSPRTLWLVSTLHHFKR
jgi:hypothetical protein